MKVFALTDQELTEVVRRSRCGVCEGMGLRFRRAENSSGEPIAGERVAVFCSECHGAGILFGHARRYAAETVAARP